MPLRRDLVVGEVKLCVLGTHWWPLLWRYFFAPFGEKACDCSAGAENLGTSGVQQLRDACVRSRLIWTDCLHLNGLCI